MNPQNLFLIHKAGMALAVLLLLIGIPAMKFGKNLRRHRFFLTLTVAAALIAFVAEFWLKMLKDKPHFGTIHGKVGLAAVILLLCTALLGRIAARGTSLRFAHKLAGRITAAAMLFNTAYALVNYVF